MPGSVIAITLGVAMLADAVRKQQSDRFAVSIFSGCGGMDTGLRESGFSFSAHVESSKSECRTLQAAGFDHVLCADVREVAARLPQAPDLLCGSPPCQPFSAASRAQPVRGPADVGRNGWPWAVSLTRTCKPKLCLFENVAGVLSHEGTPHTPGPSHSMTCSACFLAHTVRPALLDHFTHVAVWRLDAADFGVPQRRNRVLVVGSPHPLSPPAATHTLGALAHAKWVSGDYWRRHGLEPTSDGPMTREEAVALENVRVHAPSGEAWRTIRDAIGDPSRHPNRYTFRKGLGQAATEPWRLDLPSPTVTTTEVKGTRASASSNWDFSGGPDRSSDALYLATGVRRTEPGEAATLQGFPDDYPFQGSRNDVYRMVGNAVPPPLARAVGSVLFRALS